MLSLGIAPTGHPVRMEQSHHCNTRAMKQKRPSRASKNYDGENQRWSSQTAYSASTQIMGKVTTAAMVESRAGCHRLIILPCACFMGKLMPAKMMEFRASQHRPLILPYACLVKKEMRATMVELGEGHHILFILSGIHNVKKEMKAVMKE
eukprot:6809243-Ditylum_brightwellii.AAC.1